MQYCIDYDNPETFPKELRDWRSDFEKMLLSKINLENVSEWWQIRNQLQDLHIEEMDIISDFVKENMETEVAVCHCARILDVDDYWKNGIITDGGKNSVGEERIRNLLINIGVSHDKINAILVKVNKYWDRDKDSRTKSVHFFIDKNLVYEDIRIADFAINLGGKILKWALEAIDKDLYKQEPYKRLWINGTPSVIKFKCKISDIHEVCRDMLIAEIVKYFIVCDLFHYKYEFKFTGMTKGSVPPENIISIEEIKGFIEMQEKYSEFEGFYYELKDF